MNIRKWAYVPIVGGMLLLFGAFVLYRPDAITILGHAGLRRGEISRATFRAPYTGNFTVGVRMSETEAKTLAPCLADDSKFSDPVCLRRRPPLVMWFRLAERNRNPQVFVGHSIGGHYNGKFFRWDGAYVSLRRGTTYVLTTSTSAVAHDLTSSRPVLALWDSRAGIEEEAGLYRLAATAFACVLMTLGLGGTIIARRSRS